MRVPGGVFLRPDGGFPQRHSNGGVLLPRQSMPIKEAARLAQRVADEMQFELVDVELAKEPTGRFLRIFIFNVN